jgi:hypothetical protein
VLIPLPMLLAVLIACANPAPPDALTGCGDMPCKKTWVEARWAQDPQATMAAVITEGDPFARDMLALALVEAHPGETEALCAGLPEGAVQRRCKSINARPHLWQIDLEDPEAGPQGSGRVFSALQPEAPIASPWEGALPLQVPCFWGSGVTTCQSEFALESAREGRVEEAGRACQAIEAEKWRYECFFEAADGAWHLERPERVAESVQLCTGSGPYLPRCLGHLAVQIGRSAPPARGPAAAWEATQLRVENLEVGMAHHAPALLAPMLERTWSEVMSTAYSAAATISGDPLDVVSQSALPHLRAAAAQRLWLLEGGQRRSGAEWVARLEEALEDRGEDRTARPGEPPAPRDFWEERLPGEEALPRVLYLENTYRAVADTREADLWICLLEAAARADGDRRALFTEALEHPDPRVRWTAARLLMVLRPDRTLAARAAGDGDPLVSARGQRALERSKDMPRMREL